MLTPTLSKRTVAVIMGGGAGTRLFPLTKDRAKPAVPLAGKYRIVDIPISNCLNSDLRRIYLLTMFNSSSLHRHIQRTYKFDDFSGGFVEILAAQQTLDTTQGWYQGTADAVRQNLTHFDNSPHDLVLILSGDQLYHLNYQRVIEEHLATGAEITVGTIPVNRTAATGFGIMHIDAQQQVVRFVEKPKEPALLDELRLGPSTLRQLNKNEGEDLYLANMGIYVFNRSALHKCLENQHVDFGKHIIPQAIKERHVHAYIFQGYWEDIGTIDAFYKANLDLCRPSPDFDYNDPLAPVFTRPRNLPPNKIFNSTLDGVSIGMGCFIYSAAVRNTIVGIRSVIRTGAVIEDTVLMGADFFERQTPEGQIPIGIGEGTIIKKAIVDKNARIGRHCVLTPEGKPEHMDHPHFYIRDGILVVPKGASIPDGTVV